MVEPWHVASWIALFGIGAALLLEGLRRVLPRPHRLRWQPLGALRPGWVRIEGELQAIGGDLKRGGEGAFVACQPIMQLARPHGRPGPLLRGPVRAAAAVVMDGRAACRLVFDHAELDGGTPGTLSWEQFQAVAPDLAAVQQSPGTVVREERLAPGTRVVVEGIAAPPTPAMARGAFREAAPPAPELWSLSGRPEHPLRIAAVNVLDRRFDDVFFMLMGLVGALTLLIVVMLLMPLPVALVHWLFPRSRLAPVLVLLAVTIGPTLYYEWHVRRNW